ncbi:hypothetical protein [Nesterenkonia muleiensis]|uniref:hypothetical protein n=1 Tax=Nesterenkonia muleiensis TaxID=2282648 RepID=UPI000E75DE45|nr:hypothetical protein [Nesterenkonia muleiensis]
MDPWQKYRQLTAVDTAGESELTSEVYAPVQDAVIRWSSAMVILQRPNHVLRWYGMVIGLVVFAGTVWLIHVVFDSGGAGLILGAALFSGVLR